jgi:hypothetical protein
MVSQKNRRLKSEGGSAGFDKKLNALVKLAKQLSEKSKCR